MSEFLTGFAAGVAYCAVLAILLIAWWLHRTEPNEPRCVQETRKIIEEAHL